MFPFTNYDRSFGGETHRHRLRSRPTSKIRPGPSSWSCHLGMGFVRHGHMVLGMVHPWLYPTQRQHKTELRMTWTTSAIEFVPFRKLDVLQRCVATSRDLVQSPRCAECETAMFPYTPAGTAHRHRSSRQGLYPPLFAPVSGLLSLSIQPTQLVSTHQTIYESYL